MVKCLKCKIEMEKKVEEESIAGVSIGRFEHSFCKRCNEKIFSLETAKLMEKAAKAKDLWGLSSRAKFSTWGKSVGIRIPTKIAGLMKIESGETAYVIPNLEKHEIIIKV